MTLIPDPKINEMLELGLKALVGQDYFLVEKLKTYLLKERAEGKTEFRISMQSDNHIVIHPLGKDGETLDLHFNIVESPTK